MKQKSVGVLFQIRILEILLVILPGGRGWGRTPTDSKNPKTNQFPQEYIANGPPKPTPSKPRAAGTGGGLFFDLGVIPDQAYRFGQIRHRLCLIVRPIGHRQLLI